MPTHTLIYLSYTYLLKCSCISLRYTTHIMTFYRCTTRIYYPYSKTCWLFSAHLHTLIHTPVGALRYTLHIYSIEHIWKPTYMLETIPLYHTKRVKNISRQSKGHNHDFYKYKTIMKIMNRMAAGTEREEEEICLNRNSDRKVQARSWPNNLNVQIPKGKLSTSTQTKRLLAQNTTVSYMYFKDWN